MSDDSYNQTDFFKSLLQSAHTPLSFTDYKFKHQTGTPGCQLYSAYQFSWYSYNVCSVQWETIDTKQNGSKHLSVETEYQTELILRNTPLNKRDTF